MDKTSFFHSLGFINDKRIVFYDQNQNNQLDPTDRWATQSNDGTDFRFLNPDEQQKLLKKIGLNQLPIGLSLFDLEKYAKVFLRMLASARYGTSEILEFDINEVQKTVLKLPVVEKVWNKGVLQETRKFAEQRSKEIPYETIDYDARQKNYPILKGRVLAVLQEAVEAIPPEKRIHPNELKQAITQQDIFRLLTLLKQEPQLSLLRSIESLEKQLKRTLRDDFEKRVGPEEFDSVRYLFSEICQINFPKKTDPEELLRSSLSDDYTPANPMDELRSAHIQALQEIAEAEKLFTEGILPEVFRKKIDSFRLGVNQLLITTQQELGNRKKCVKAVSKVLISKVKVE